MGWIIQPPPPPKARRPPPLLAWSSAASTAPPGSEPHGNLPIHRAKGNSALDLDLHPGNPRKRSWTLVLLRISWNPQHPSGKSRKLTARPWRYLESAVGIHRLRPRDMDNTWDVRIEHFTQHRRNCGIALPVRIQTYPTHKRL